jgi:hypothetical protein
LRKFEPAGTSISFFSLTKLTFGMERSLRQLAA